MLKIDEFYDKVKDPFVERLRIELPQGCKYHSPEHTLDVIAQAEIIGNAIGLNNYETAVVKTAALFHDAGFMIQRKNHEQLSSKIFTEYAKEFLLPQESIDDVNNCIAATEIPQNPKGKMEFVLCDADLDYLGRDDFDKIADLLYEELLQANEIRSKEQWDKIQVIFLSMHKYHTAYSKENRQEKLLVNLESVKQRLNNE